MPELSLNKEALVKPSKEKLNPLVEVSPNPEADILEETLGISFAEKPQKILLTFKNRLALFLYHRDLFPSISKVLRIEKNSFAARYFPKHNTFIQIVSDDKGKEPVEKLYYGEVTSLHENMHGWIENTNQEIHNVRLETEIPSLLLAEDLTPEDKSNLEKSTVYRCFDEGLAEWGAIETLIRSNAKHQDEVFENELYKTHQDYDQSDRFEEFFSKTNIMATGTLLRTFRSLLQFDEKSAEKIRQQIDETNSVGRKLGHLFATKVMVNLRSSGLGIAEALTLLVKNPPQTMNDLHDPNKFSQDLLSIRNNKPIS